MSAIVNARSLPAPRSRLVGGNMIDFARDPVGFMLRLGAQDRPEIAPVKRFVLNGMNAFLIRDVDMIHDILVKHAASFYKGRTLEEAKRLLGEGLLTSEGDTHRRHRRLMQPSFTPRHIAQYADTMIRLAESTVADWHDGQSISTTHEMMQLTLAVITQTMFGFDSTANVSRVEDNINLVIKSVAPSLRKLLPMFLQRDGKVQRAVDTLNTTMNEIILARRQQDTSDQTNLLSLLMAARDEGDGTGLTDEDLRDEVMTIYMAGHETTANLLAWTFVALSENPDVERKLHQEIDTVLGDGEVTFAHLPQLQYTQQVVKESLRLYPPAWTIGRTAIADITLRDVHFHKGDTLFMSQYVMHRDERYFDQPNTFRPERFTSGFEQKLPTYAYFPFGGGARICIGNHFAMMEAQLLLAVICRKFRLLRVNSKPVERFAGITMRPKGDLRMRLEQRQRTI